MPRKKPGLGDFTEVQHGVRVTLSEDHLNGSGRLVGKVNEQTATLRNIVGDIQKNGRCLLNENMMFYAAQVLRDAYLDRLRRGYAVDVLGLGKIYHALDGTFRSELDTPSARPKLVPRFTPSKTLLAACEKLVCSVVRRSDTAPVVWSVRSLPDDGSDVVRVGTLVRVCGRNLKLAGDGAGVFFLPQAGGDAVCVPPERMGDNFPRSLMFYLPPEVTPGAYALEVRTRWSRNGRLRQELCAGKRIAITVV